MSDLRCPSCGSLTCSHLVRILGDPALTEVCVFCDLDKIATPVARETALGVPLIVFEPMFPVTAGHLLVAPVRHVAHAAADPVTAGACMVHAAGIAGRYGSANIITSIGREATQSIRHLHLHVVPRADDDGLALPWSSGRTKVKGKRRG